jgi:alkanesulfonate monooxygenase SsuD/methylene tetrahydromethanopterin reductase-like flavin-dependent oxidoreductase (luciferase family)
VLQYRIFHKIIVIAVPKPGSRIGLVATTSTSFPDPSNLAGQLGSLDHLSGGRSGWNLVTSVDPSAAYNLSRDAIIVHADRSNRAEEFVDVVHRSPGHLRR